MSLVYSPLKRHHAQKAEKKAEQQMPLLRGKFKKAFDKNVETEMHEGKPQKQSLAIAYSIKKQAQKKKMAKGGMVHPDADHSVDDREMEMLDKHPLESPLMKYDDMESPEHEEMEHSSEDLAGDIVDRIMVKMKHMSKGGMVDGDEPDQHDMKKDMSHDDGQVDLPANGAEQKNHLDDMSFDALHDPMTDESMLDEATQPEDSNMHGHEIDSDDHDMVDVLRRKIMSRRR